MVLRPHVLRYKNKLKQIDKDKMQKIRAAAVPSQEIANLKIMPRMNSLILMSGFVLLSMPVCYLKYLSANSD